MAKYGTIALLCSWLILAGLALAQTTSTAIVGTVTDATGAVVPGARLTLLKVATGERRSMTTTATGDYGFPLLETGAYTMTAEAKGFQLLEKTGIVLELQQRARVDFQLSVGGATSTVEVVGTAVQLKTEDAGVGQVITNKQVAELPLQGRNLSSLAVLTPGVQYGARQGFDGQGGYMPGRDVSVSANGQREVSQQITMDGISSTTNIENVMHWSPSVDAIEEFKVQTGSYSAEYGQANGALVQVSFKAGTNAFRGTVYEFLRNEKLDAENYFLNFGVAPQSPRKPKNALRRNQFGAYLGGPVVLPGLYNGKNRTFWSFSYEGWRQNVENVTQGFFYPQAFRNGDFSALLTPPIVNGKPLRAPVVIYDPMTGEPFRDGSGRITNVIPASRINKNAQAFVNTYQPLPTQTPEDPLANNITRGVPDVMRTNGYVFRIDHNFGPNDRIYFRYLTDRGYRNTQSLNPNFENFRVMNPTNLVTQWIHVFNPRLLNELRVGNNYQSDALYNPRSNTNFDLDSLGIGKFRIIQQGNRTLTPQEAGIPITFIGGDTDTSVPSKSTNNNYQFYDSLVLFRGSHNFKTGFAFNRPASHWGSSNNPRGSITASEGGYGLAGWLLGYPSTTMSAEGDPYSESHQNLWSAYFLDDWRASGKLTLNMGLRWDFFQVPRDRIGSWRNLRLDILSTGADGKQYPTMIPPVDQGQSAPLYDNLGPGYFMPRVGLAYQVAPKWVVRSGFGWFVHPGHIGSPGLLNRNPPGGGTFSFSQVTTTGQVIPYSYGGQSYNITTRKYAPGSPVLTLDNAFPDSVNLTSQRANVILIPPDNKYANDVQWSLDIQRALPWNTYLTVAYVGSKSSNVDNSVTNFNSPDPSSNTDINAGRPYQGYVSQGESNAVHPLGTIRYMDAYSNGSYHGLQVSGQKRYSRGLTMGLSYVYSKALGEGYERNGGIAFQNPRDRRADRQRYSFDVTHNAVINYVYEMPFLNRFKGVAGAFLRGWQTNGVITLRSGFPFGVSGGTLNTGSASRPDRIADGRISNPTRQLWFDPTAFRRTDCNIGRPDLCHYGDAGPNILVSPGGHTADLSLMKNWQIRALGESGRMQFRAEAFNAFNTPQFGQPNGIGFSSSASIVPDAPQQGEITTLRTPMRIIQLGLKLYF
jgi:hypothetical protein